MKILFLLLLSFQCLASSPHHVYFVTNAETKHQKISPPLSNCGRLRAVQLSNLLSYSKIEHIYSTTDLSAMETANPLATKNAIPVKVFTDKLLDSLAVTVIKEPKNALIVADINTITFLVEFISKKKLVAPARQPKNILYQVTISGNDKILSIFKQPLEC